MSESENDAFWLRTYEQRRSDINAALLAFGMNAPQPILFDYGDPPDVESVASSVKETEA